MTILPQVKLKAVVSFPAAVLDGAGIDVTKQNGTYKFDIAFDDFAPPVAGITDPAHQCALLWNSVTKAYVLAPVTIIGAGGSVPEAPTDGTQYGRQNLNWTPIVTGGTPSSAPPLMDGFAAAGTSANYSRGDHVHPTDSSRAALVSPVFVGDPQAPTATVGDNDASIATTAFVTTAVANAVTSPALATPLMDGAAVVGVATKYAREDHVHPSDTSRQASDADLTAVAALSGTGIARRTSNTPTWTVGTGVTNSELAGMAAYTFKGNNTAGVASPTDIDIAALTAKASPAGGDFLLLSDQAASGAWKKIAISTLPGASGGIAEAPNDGQMYGRQSLGWAVVTGGGGASPSNVLPTMNGTANAGVATLYSRGDHVHPSDTSRQALDAELTAIAGLVSAVDTLPYFTGSGTAALTAFTAYARTLVAAVDATTARATLGIGNPAALSKANDTNVTLTLSGTPATALLQATTITAGWTGTLATNRGGFGADVSAANGIPLFTAGVPAFTATSGSGIIALTNSPTFTGDPKAPTPTAGDNDTSIATTAFVTAAIAAGGGGASPSNANPIIDGVAAPGVSTLYARGDHVHPSPLPRFQASLYGVAAGNTAAANATGLVNAVAAAAAAGGGIIEFNDSGTIQYSSTININNSNIIFRGRGKATNLQYTGAAQGLAFFSNIDTCAIQNIQLSATNAAAVIVQISSFNQSFFFNNVYFVGGGVHVQLTSATTTTGGAYGIHLIGGNSSGAAICFLQVHPGGAFAGLDQAIFIDHFDADGFAQYLDCNGFGNCVTITNCRIERHLAATTSAIAVACTTRFLIANCYIEDDCTVPWMTTSNNVSGVTLENNYFTNNVAGGSHPNAIILKTSSDILNGLSIRNNSISIGGTVGNLFDTGASPILAMNNIINDGVCAYGFATTATPANRVFIANRGTATFTTAIEQATGVGLKGTNTADNAAAGYIGEYISASGSGISLSNGTDINICSMTITPGDWELRGSIMLSQSGATLTVMGASLNNASATFNFVPGYFSRAFTTGGITLGFTATPVVMTRILINVPQVWYLIAETSFSGGTVTASGLLEARRMR